MAVDEFSGRIPPVLDRGRRFCRPSWLITAAFLCEVFQRSDPDNPIDRPSLSGDRPPEVMDQGILQPIIPVSPEGSQSKLEGANKNQPGTNHSIWGNSSHVIQTRVHHAPREAISLAYRSRYLTDLFPINYTPMASHPVTSPAFRWKRPVLTTPHQQV